MDNANPTQHPVPDFQSPELYDGQGRERQAHNLVPDLQQDSYTPQEIANLFGMSEDVIRHAVQRGELPAERAGHDIVGIYRADLLAWLDRRGPGL